MGSPRKLNRYEAVEVLSPLVMPMIRDRAVVGSPVGSNQRTAGVPIFYEGRVTVTLTTDQYEMFRVQVLQYIQDRLGSKPFLMVSLGEAQIDLLIRDRINTVFADE